MPVSQPHSMTQERVIAKVQYIKDLSFEVPRAPAIYQAIRVPPVLDVRLDVRSSPVESDDRTFEVILTVRIVAWDSQMPRGTPQSIEFVTDLTYGGLFTLASVPSEDTDEVLSTECPQILYPFAAAILADLSRDANFAPIALGPVDFARLWQERGRESEPNDPTA